MSAVASATMAMPRRSWLARHRWLALRRASQFGFLALFLSGPWLGIWIAKGTLASSLTLDVLPLTDPLFLLQSVLAGHWPANQALIGAAIVALVYAVVAGRMYCAWVCPVNPVADLAHVLRRKFGLARSIRIDRRLRYWLLAAILLAAAVTGSVVWEQVNPVTLTHRALVYGALGGSALAMLALGVLFLFDFGLAERGFCGHVCPVGAFYGLLGRFRLLRLAAPGRARCDDCAACFAVCPEPRILSPALRQPAGQAAILDPVDCTGCGRCADVCPHSVFAFTVGGKS